MKITDSAKFQMHVAVFPQWPHRDTALYALAYPQCVVGMALNQIASKGHANDLQELVATVCGQG